MSEDYEARAHKQLQIESWSNAARTLLVRGATDGGPFAESHTTNSDRSRATDTFELHGLPTKLQVNPSAGPVRRGECYVRVTLLLDGEPVQRLSAGYLTDSKTMSWPPGVFEAFTDGPGLIRILTGTNPAAGAEITETVPTNAKWRLKSVSFSLVADATVVNRTIGLALDDGATTYMLITAGAVQTAGQTKFYNYISGYPERETAFDGQAYIRTPLPPNLDVFQGWRFRTATISLQAGDDLSAASFVVEEWIEE